MVKYKLVVLCERGQVRQEIIMVHRGAAMYNQYRLARANHFKEQVDAVDLFVSFKLGIL